jgi:hypothetical protein
VSSTLTPSVPDPPVGSVAERLDQLEALHAEGVITDAELTEARRRLVLGERAGGASGSPAVPSSSNGKGPGRLLGAPYWLVAIVGAAIVGAGIVLALLVLTGGDSKTSSAKTSSAKTSSASVQQAYLVSIRRPLAQLTSSTVATGRLLGHVNGPAALPGARATVSRQLDVVDSARQGLSSQRVPAAEQPAQAALVRAATEQRRYLVLLGRVLSPPAARGLTILDKTRASGGHARSAYRAFFALLPGTPDAISGIDLTDTSGIAAALRQQISPVSAPPATPVAPPPSTPAVFSGLSFQSPTGNIRCESRGSDLVCSTSNDSFAVFLPVFGAPSTGSGIASGGQSVPYGRTWVNGPFSCDSAFNGVTCRSLSSGQGFFLNRTDYRPF